MEVRGKRYNMELLKLANTGLGKNATPTTMLNAYTESAIGEKRSAWKTAVVVWKTVHHEKFKEYFETQEKYAEQIGYTKSYVSKQVRAVDCYGELMKVDTAFENVSVGFVSELLLLNKEIDADLLADFIQTMGVECTETRDSIRQKVKEYKGIINGAVDTRTLHSEEPEEQEPEEQEPEEQEPEMLVNNCVLTDSLFGSIVITNPDLKNDLYNLLRNYGYEI